MKSAARDWRKQLERSRGRRERGSGWRADGLCMRADQRPQSAAVAATASLCVLPKHESERREPSRASYSLSSLVSLFRFSPPFRRMSLCGRVPAPDTHLSPPAWLVPLFSSSQTKCGPRQLPNSLQEIPFREHLPSAQSALSSDADAGARQTPMRGVVCLSSSPVEHRRRLLQRLRRTLHRVCRRVAGAGLTRRRLDGSRIRVRRRRLVQDGRVPAAPSSFADVVRCAYASRVRVVRRRSPPFKAQQEQARRRGRVGPDERGC